MIFCLICGGAVGAALSLRFNVMSLIPAIFSGTMIVGFKGVAQGESIWSILETMAVLNGAMQAGYLVAHIAPPANGTKRLNAHDGKSMPSGISRPI
jgi:hypothetical protein